MPGATANARKIVLIVEDEPILRMMAVDIVEDAGLEALTASDADEAILILETRSDIHLVFTDIDMPGSIDGLKLAAFVRDRWPPVLIIVTSGHTRPDEAAMPEHSIFVPKPYKPAELAEMLRRLSASV
jgi:CheY-like chemotaxis protein